MWPMHRYIRPTSCSTLVINYNISVKNISCVGNSLVIESTAPAGGVAVFDEGFCYFFVEFISQSLGHAFPAQDDNNNNSIGAVVPGPLLHNT